MPLGRDLTAEQQGALTLLLVEKRALELERAAEASTLAYDDEADYTFDDIRRLYHMLCLKHHPDKTEGHKQTPKYTNILNAYNLLKEGLSPVVEFSDEPAQASALRIADGKIHVDFSKFREKLNKKEDVSNLYVDELPDDIIISRHEFFELLKTGRKDFSGCRLDFARKLAGFLLDGGGISDLDLLDYGLPDDVMHHVSFENAVIFSFSTFMNLDLRGNNFDSAKFLSPVNRLDCKNCRTADDLQQILDSAGPWSAYVQHCELTDVNFNAHVLRLEFVHSKLNSVCFSELQTVDVWGDSGELSFCLLEAGSQGIMLPGIANEVSSTALTVAAQSHNTLSATSAALALPGAAGSSVAAQSAKPAKVPVSSPVTVSIDGSCLTALTRASERRLISQMQTAYQAKATKNNSKGIVRGMLFGLSGRLQGAELTVFGDSHLPLSSVVDTLKARAVARADNSDGASYAALQALGLRHSEIIAPPGIAAVSNAIVLRQPTGK
jgi:hypothetical protein